MLYFAHSMLSTMNRNNIIFFTTVKRMIERKNMPLEKVAKNFLTVTIDTTFRIISAVCRYDYFQLLLLRFERDKLSKSSY